ncbi:MAG: 30S ribosomal protein S13, partial [Phycisphaerales bacterium]|nr:30S ribosomal protein S13 [Phycisphaerales bacterium]
MPRIAGVDIPDRKKIYYSLQYIHGIGPKFAGDLLEEAKIDRDMKTNDLSETEVSLLNTIVDNNFLVEGALRRQVQQNIQRLREIRSYRGDR